MTVILARLVLPLWLVSSAVAAAAAQTVTPDPAGQAARELLAITLGGDLPGQLMNQLLAPIADNLRPGLQQALNRAPTEADVAAFRSALQRAFASVFTADVWADAFVPIVATSFTVGEVNELIAFLKTPLGQKLLSSSSRVSRGAQRLARR